MSGPVLETARLILRPPEKGDLGLWAEKMADPEGMLHFGGPQPEQGAWRAMAMILGAWAMDGASLFSVVEKSSGRWIGRVGPWFPRGWPGPEIGWSLDRAVWGKGYATEAAACAMDWAFDELGWPEAFHVIAPLNEPSKAVARRLGSRLLREIDAPGLRAAGTPAPRVELWGQSREEWRARLDFPAPNG